MLNNNLEYAETFGQWLDTNYHLRKWGANVGGAIAKAVR